MKPEPKRFLVHGGLFLCMLLTTLLACNLVTSRLPSSTSPAAGTLGTYAAQTLDVRRTAAASALQLATETPLPAAGSPGSLPVISAQVNTNCRQGPNIIYDRLGYLLVGKQSTVYGLNQEHTWWYIANPTHPGEYCWVWGQTTTVAGDIASLPVVEPPAAIETAFEADFAGLKRCFGSYHIVFQVHNTGDQNFHSASLTIHTLKSHAVVFSHLIPKPFLSNANDCPPGRNTLFAGNTAYIAIEKTPDIPFDKELRAAIVLCTQADPAKTCVQQKVEFTLKK